MKANRLAREKSPYLLQHAHNPVDWYPWGEEAFERARREHKPVFLSVGYSTCHWCHVMERESFADEEVARLLNGAFVCIKVDREERPDLDQHFMAVCQMLTGSGGWPLTVVMTPDKRPFFAGTYFPKARRWGRVGMMELVPRLREAWEMKREEVLRAAGTILSNLERSRAGIESPDAEEGSGRLSAEVLERAFRELEADFDQSRGGFGNAPKFPIPHHAGFLLRYAKRAGSAEAGAMAERTLQAMRRGGIYDHLGSGFHRYSTDADWLLPHFEKMLYDQALLIEVYAEAYAAAGNECFRRTAEDVAAYVARDLTSPEGGFYTAEDADSEGQEGRFYVWTAEELREVLGEEDGAFAAKVFNVRPGGNFSEQGHGPDGRNILHLTEPPTEAGSIRLRTVRDRLFAAREKRVRPFKDTKMLADWNGLMIGALARLARLTGNEKHLRAADRAADLILDRMRDPDGRLLHMLADGEARVPAFLDDYAFLVKGLIDLYEAGFDPGRLERALDLVGQAVERLWDDKGGGFFFAAADPDIAVRRKEIYDGAVPAGNSVMLMNLLRLARMTGRADLESLASRQAAAFAAEVAGHPRMHTEFLRGLDFALGPSHEIVIAGRRAAPETRELVDVLRKAYLPNAVVLFKPVDEPEAARALERLAPFTKDMDAGGGAAAARVCSAGACLRPVRSANGLRAILK
ncbi:MAG: thioredoxin domain-containing protein [Candidatus Aminicenantes bacterium]